VCSSDLPYEQQVSQSEQALNAYQDEQRAYNEALDLFNAKIPIGYVDDSKVRDYYLKMIQSRTGAEQYKSSIQNDIQSGMDLSALQAKYPEATFTTENIPATTLPVQTSQVLASSSDVSKPSFLPQPGKPKGFVSTVLDVGESAFKGGVYQLGRGIAKGADYLIPKQIMSSLESVPVTPMNKQILEPLYPEKGAYLFTAPSRTIPQMVTAGGEYKTQPVPIFTPTREQVKTGAEIAVTAPLFMSKAKYVLEPFFLGRSVQAAANPELSFWQRLLAGGVAAGIAGGAGLRGFNILTKPITITEGRMATDLIARDVIIPVREGGEKGKFILTSTTTTPQIIKTNLFRKSLGLKPKEVIPSRTYVYKSYTPFAIRTNEGAILQPANIITKRVGAKFGTVSRLAGESAPLDLESFAKLSKNQQRILQAAAERKAGIPVAMERVPSILGKNFQYSTENIGVRKMFRMTIKPAPDTVTLFHGTTSTSANNILRTGLKPAKTVGVSRGLPVKLPEVYLTSDIERAKGWAGRAVFGKGKLIPGEKVAVLEANIPVNVFKKSLIRRSIENGGGDEFVFKSIPAKYFGPKSSGSFIFKQLPKSSAGRTISISETGTIAKEIPLAESKPYKLYNYQTGSKDITMPFSRASGKIPVIKGKSIVFELPSQVEEGTSATTLQVLKPSAKSVETFKKMQVAASKTIPKVKMPSFKTSNVPVSIEVAPVLKLAKRGALSTEAITSSSVKTIPAQVITVKPNQVLISKEETSQKNIQVLKPGFVSREFNISLPKSTEISKSTVIQENRNILKEMLKSRQESKQMQKTAQISRTTLKPAEVLKPKGKITTTFKLNPTSSAKVRLKAAFAKLGKGYEVLIRSKKKIVSIGKNLPLGKALELGVKRTKAGTEQTFALRESGVTSLEDISYKVPSNLFAAPKRARTRITPLTFTERRGKTLTTGAEIRGLKSARRTGRKLRWF
jgi:hypothetical protein